MGAFLSPRLTLIMATLVVLVTLFITTVNANEDTTTEDITEDATTASTTTADAKDPRKCLEFHLPRGIDLRTPKAKTDPVQRPRLTDSPARTTVVAIGAVLIVVTNLLLCHLLFWDPELWGQRTYKMLFNLAVTDLITGVLLGFAVVVEM